MGTDGLASRLLAVVAVSSNV
ncbi:uncharacterized protein G2W53_027137 [Senna tora]|uniref:Uncharacterized protein n=1 Tax=Senna tora TaxID=362788 RepID=A0A834TGE1_9FABA|nr:uncharacterized protein G2W53_027137 [Senna tora]